MFRSILCFLLLMLILGCSGEPNLTTAKLDAMEKGMSLNDAEKMLGDHNTVVTSPGGGKTIQWTEGEGDSLKSITMNFAEDKMTMKIGTNLK